MALNLRSEYMFPPFRNNATLEATHADLFGDETEVNMSNINTTYPVPSTPNIRIHKDHSLENMIGNVQSGEEPKKVIQALKDPSRIEAMQEELLQFKFNKFGHWWIYLMARGPLEPNGSTGTRKMRKEFRLISWQCKKQTIFATSTTKAEYVAATSCCRQVLWIQNQMLDYGYNFMNTKIFIDNERTICIVKNPVFHSKTKHIEIRHHFIRDSNEKKLIQMIKIHTDLNVANLLTKAFDIGRFQYLTASIGMLNP
ncbi:hypothetical protein Tco_0742560 [Tanacetum coccineum]